MASFSRTTVDVSIETQITTAIVVSTVFLSKITSIFNPDFMVNSYLKRICLWSIKFFEEYGVAPNTTIQSIFELEKHKLEKAEQELVSGALAKLSREYARGEELNVDYIYDNALKYFEKRDLSLRLEKASLLKDAGRYDEAKEILTINPSLENALFRCTDIFDPAFVDKVFSDDNKGILEFPGAMGDLLGSIKRGWLIGILGGFKKGKCISAKSLILLADGSLKTIEDVCKDRDKFLLTMNDVGKFEKAQIIDYLDQGEQDVYRLTTRTGRQIDLTKNHPLFTPSSWKKLEDILEGDFIAVPRKYPILGTETFPEYKIKLLAYLLADGSFRGSITYTKQNKDMQNDFIRCGTLMGDIVNLRSATEEDEFVLSSGRLGRYSQSNTRLWIESLGLFNKLSKEKTIPDFVFNLKKSDLSLFLRTLYSGDGSVWKERNNIIIEYSSASKKLVYQIQNLLLRFGIISKIKETKKYYDKEGERFLCWALSVNDTINIHRFYRYIGFQYEKQDRLEFLLDSIKKRCRKSNIEAVPFEVISSIVPYDRRSKCDAVKQCYTKKGKICYSRFHELIKDYPDLLQLKEVYENDILWDSVASIEYLEKEKTYDLEIEGHHNFIANDIVVHNSQYMMEFSIQALLSKLNVVFFSLEMQEEDLAKRVYKRISGLGDKEEMFFPMFDCYRNQTGECDMRERPDTRTIRTQGKRELIKYVPDYTPCSFCRGRFDSYVPEIYYENLKVKEFNLKNVRKNLKAFELMYGRRFHLFRYPRFSASYDDIERDLMQLEAREGVIPDVIVVDYANILKPGKYASDKKTDYIDDIWKNLARLAGEKHAIVVTGCQGNRPSLKKEIQEEEDIADWIGILGHVDIFMALNQIPFEKEKQLIRFNLLEHRHRKFSPDRSVIVLQNLDVGQTLLDSEWER